MSGHRFGYDDQAFLLDGRPFQIRSGELHYFRIPREYWRDRLLKARALGLNTVCTYMPWNLHEPRPGSFDFTGMLDAAAFLKLAHELGLWALLRPGPYICAEWDFGGLPAWLLSRDGMRIRCSEPNYLAAVRRYLARVGEELSPLQCVRGGPVLMVQVENEYGSYGNDKAYLIEVRDALRAAGFDVPLFTSDDSKPYHLRTGSLDDCLATVNFGAGDPDQRLATLRAFRPRGPLMCAEYWCGWFDAWGQPRQGNSTGDANARDVGWMVDQGVSFNLYVLHGGTNFGFTSGANCYDQYTPTVTSYDYHAPLDESGRPTPKYWAIRDALAERQPPGTVLPEVPPPTRTIRIAAVEFTESASLFDALGKGIVQSQPKPMEAVGQSAGLVLYRTTIPAHSGGMLRLVRVADRALVFLDGRKVGTLDRSAKEDALELPSVAFGGDGGGATLDILVEAMGRVNFGPASMDRKGITQRVELDHLTLMGWTVFPLPLDAPFLAHLRFGEADVPGPSFHRARFHVEAPGDTFLDMRGWAKGVVWVNGHNLGRFWRVGPQQTLYCPGVWLNEGENEIVVFDAECEGRQAVAGLAEPVLDELLEAPTPAQDARCKIAG